MAANSYSFEVTAKDSASKNVATVTKAVADLTRGLGAAATAYNTLGSAQGKLAPGNVTIKIVEQTKATKDSTSAAEKKAQAIAAAERMEQQAYARTNQERLKMIGASNLVTAKATSDAAKRTAALDAEVSRAQALVAQYKAMRDAAKAAYNDARGNKSANPDDARAAQAAKIAAQDLKFAQGQLKSAVTDANTAIAAQKANLAQLTTAENQAASAAQRFAESQMRAAQSSAQANAMLNQTRYALYQTAAAYTALSKATLGTAVNVAQTAISYESAFNTVARTSGLGQEARSAIESEAQSATGQLAILKDELVDISTTLGTSFEDVAGITALGAQLGIASADLNSFTQVVAKFASTTNVTTEAAAMGFGRLQNILDVPTEKFVNLASAISELGVNSVATESEILNTTVQIGAMANNAGFSTEYVLGLGTALASLRVAPELARGSTTAIFANITRAAAEGEKGLKDYAAVMGISAAASKELWESSPDQFFTKLITGLGQADDAGQNLTLILDELGIKQRRDVSVITRLAGSYQLLADYTAQASDSFAAGTYLGESYATSAETAQKALDRLAASFSAFTAGVGSAFLAPIAKAADILAGAFDWLADLPAGIGPAVLGFTAMLGVIFAIRAAVALAGAAYLAMTTATRNLGLENLKVGGVIGAVRTAVAQQAAAANVAAPAMSRLAVANNAVATSAGGAAVATRGLTVGMGTVAASSGAAAAGMNTAAVASKRFQASLGPLGWLLLGVGAFVGLFAGVGSAADEAAVSMAEYNQKLVDMRSAYLTSGTGAEGLEAAIKKDTAAFNEAGSVADKANGAYRTFTKTSQTLADGSIQLGTSIRDGSGKEIEFLEGRLLTAEQASKEFTTSVKDLTGAQPAAAASIGETTEQLKDQVKVLGENALAWKAQADTQALNAAFDTPEEKAAFESLKAQRPEVLSAMFGKPGQTAAEIAANRSIIRDFLAEYQRNLKAIDAIDSQLEPAKAISKTQEEIAALQAKRAELVAQSNVLKNLKDTYDTAQSAFQEFMTNSAFNASVKEVVGYDEVVDDAAETMEKAASTADTLEEKLRKAADAFKGMFDAASGDISFESDITGALEEIGRGLVENGISFDTFTEEGRANLDNLNSAIQAYANNQADAFARGEISAQTAAANTHAFMSGLLSDLSNMGVDTSQLDYLNQYAISLTGEPWTMMVGADTTSAMINLQNTANYAAQVVAFMGQSVGRAVSAAANRAQQALGGWLGMTNRFTGADDTYSYTPPKAPTAPAQSKVGSGLGRGRQIAENEALEKAAKDAGKAGKEAGEAAEDAAADAAEAIKKQEEYVRDLAAAYKDLASNAFKGVTAEGDAFAALEKFGESLLENGKSFNTVTEEGRNNFDALIDTFDAYGSTLSVQIEAGLLTAEQAAGKYREFASGIYGELTKMGVGTQEISGFFQALGVDAGVWSTASDDVKQYGGVLSEATVSTEAMAEANKKLADSFRDLTTNAFKGVTTQGDVFASLQKLGDSLFENGKRFDIFTQKGRDNFAALSDVFDSFGGTLADQIESGVITADQATKKYEDFAGGVYSELLRMGVPLADISSFFSTLGVKAGSWAKTGDDVKVYGGFISEAAKGMKELAEQTELAKLITEAYGDALQKAFDNKFGVAAAVDTTQKAINGLKNAYQESIDKVKELAAANKQLSADLSVRTADKRLSDIEKAISKKYGEGDRAKKYGADSDKAAADIADIKKQIADNKKLSEQTKKDSTALKGNTDAAIENREGLRGLQQQMLAQIETYAKTGASTKQVAEYTDRLKKKFQDAAVAAGFSKDQVRGYTAVFESYKSAINNVPTVVKTKVAVEGVKAARDALNSVPKGKKSLTITASARVQTATREIDKAAKNRKNTITSSVTVAPMSRATRAALAAIPKSSDYVIKPRVDQGAKQSAANSLASLNNGFTPSVEPKLVGDPFAKLKNFFGFTQAEIRVVKYADGGGVGGIWTGGVVPSFGGYAKGGKVQGAPPANRQTDNKVARGPGGERIGLQGGEGVLNLRAMATPGVSEWMDAVNGGTRGYYAGGNTAKSGGSTRSGPIVAQLPTELKILLQQIRDKQTNLYTSDQLVATSSDNGFAHQAARGTN